MITFAFWDKFRNAWLELWYDENLELSFDYSNENILAAIISEQFQLEICFLCEQVAQFCSEW